MTNLEIIAIIENNIRDLQALIDESINSVHNRSLQLEYIDRWHRLNTTLPTGNTGYHIGANPSTQYLNFGLTTSKILTSTGSDI